MTQYIDKSAVVAEIEKRKAEAESNCCGYKSYEKHIYNDCIVDFYEEFLEILDTLEVKEVDLEEVISGLTVGWIEGEEYGELQNINTARCVTLEEVKEAMRCIYELGLNTQRGE